LVGLDLAATLGGLTRVRNQDEIGAPGRVPRLSIDETCPGTVFLPLDELVPPRVIAVYWHRERQPRPAAGAPLPAA
jgi:hypothetical protein